MVLMRVMLLPPKTTLSLINLLILWLHLCVAPAPSAAMLPLCQLLSLPSLQKSIKLRKPMEGVWGTTIYRFQKDLRNEIRGFASLNDNSPTRLWNNNQNKSFSLCFFFSLISRVLVRVGVCTHPWSHCRRSEEDCTDWAFTTWSIFYSFFSPFFFALFLFTWKPPTTHLQFDFFQVWKLRHCRPELSSQGGVSDQ